MKNLVVFFNSFKRKSQIQMKNIVSTKNFSKNNPKKLLNNFLATTEISVSMSPSFKVVFLKKLKIKLNYFKRKEI